MIKSKKRLFCMATIILLFTIISFSYVSADYQSKYYNLGQNLAENWTHSYGTARAEYDYRTGPLGRDRVYAKGTRTSGNEVNAYVYWEGSTGGSKEAFDWTTSTSISVQVRGTLLVDAWRTDHRSLVYQNSTLLGGRRWIGRR